MQQSSPPWRVFDGPNGPHPPADRKDPHGEPVRGAPTVQPPVIAAIGAAVLIGGLAVVVAMGGMGAVAAGPERTDTALASSALVDASGQIVVDVSGAVVAPGLYRLNTGARVGDAVDAAGGFSPRVDAGQVAAELNLAAPLADGQQVRVPSRDDPTPGSGGSGAGGSGAAGGAGGSGSGLIDLNAATQAELESLPGIGPVTAAKIIEARTQARFRTIDELRERGLVGEKTFDSLKALIAVG